jgi:hypothetical protein
MENLQESRLDDEIGYRNLRGVDLVFPLWQIGNLGD